MQTVLVELKNKTVIDLLIELEKMDLIRLLQVDPKDKSQQATKFRGAISKNKANELNKQLLHTREEWSRNF